MREEQSSDDLPYSLAGLSVHGCKVGPGGWKWVGLYGVVTMGVI